MINGVVSINGSSNAQSTEVSLSVINSKNLESQLTIQQQRLTKISSDPKMSEQEKMKERQKIEQQIAELNRKLRMEQIKENEKEQKSKIIVKEEVQKDDVQKEDVPEDKDKEKSKVQEENKVAFKELSPKEIYNILNMNSETQQKRVMENMERKKDGIENVLEAEIKMDSLHGIENTAKNEQLSELRKEMPIQIKVLGFEEENTLGINHNRKIVIKDSQYSN